MIAMQCRCKKKTHWSLFSVIRCRACVINERLHGLENFPFGIARSKNENIQKIAWTKGRSLLGLTSSLWQLVQKAHSWYMRSGCEYFIRRSRLGNIPSASDLCSYDTCFSMHNILGTWWQTALKRWQTEHFQEKIQTHDQERTCEVWYPLVWHSFFDVSDPLYCASDKIAACLQMKASDAWIETQTKGKDSSVDKNINHKKQSMYLGVFPGVHTIAGICKYAKKRPRSVLACTLHMRTHMHTRLHTQMRARAQTLTIQHAKKSMSRAALRKLAVVGLWPFCNISQFLVLHTIRCDVAVDVAKGRKLCAALTKNR